MKTAKMKKVLLICLLMIVGLVAYAQKTVIVIEPLNVGDSIFIYDFNCNCKFQLPEVTDTTLLQNRIKLATDGINEFEKLFAKTKSLYHLERKGFWKKQLVLFEEKLAKQKAIFERD